ncbi:MAG: LPD1 domain-containing protein [Anaerovoracaceae bacterium]
MGIQDFGEHIGGAKKELWSARGLNLSDIADFNDAERAKFIKKENVWKKPDYEKMVADGMPVRVAYFIKLIRDGLPTKPNIYSFDSAEERREKEEGYIRVVTDFKEKLLSIKSEDELYGFFDNVIAGYLENPQSRNVRLKPEAYGCITNKMLKAASLARHGFYYIDKDIEKKQFCYTQEDKILAPFTFMKYTKDSVSFDKGRYGEDMVSIKRGSSVTFLYPDAKWCNENEWKEGTYFILKGRSSLIERNFETEDAAKAFILDKYKDHFKEGKAKPSPRKRKKAFIPKQLQNIERTGEDFRKGTKITGNDYLNAFLFRGGEFGNWMNEKDRQASLNFGYDALLDMCQAINISPSDISLGGRLAIAFGARGSGNALAHYEPLREVINLTKMKGAGSLAHEWAHAMDDIVGKKLGLDGMMTSKILSPLVPKVFKDLIDTMQYKEKDGKLIRTDFYSNSIGFDKSHAKTDHGYWQSDAEMLARAFACYVTDKLKSQGKTSDYLSGHSELAVDVSLNADGIMKVTKAIPEGREREAINKAFDAFFLEMRKEKIFQPFDKAPEISDLEKGPKSLDLKISRTKENMPDYNKLLTENKRGQLEFNLFEK